MSVTPSYLKEKPKFDKRKILNYRHNSKCHKPIVVTPEIKAGGDAALAAAKKDHENRLKDSDRRTVDMAHDEAGYIAGKARGRIMLAPVMSETFRRNYDRINWRN